MPVSSLAQSDIDSLSKLLNRPADTVKVNLLLKVASIYRSKKNNLDSAEIIATEAKNLAEEIQYDSGLFQAYIFLYSVADNKTDFNKAREIAIKQLEIAERMKNPILIIGSKSSISKSYRLLGFTSKAIELDLEIYSLAMKLNEPEAIAFASSRLGLAYSLTDASLSNQYYLEALSNYQKLKNLPGMRNAYEDIALNYERLGNYEKAIEMHKKSLAISVEHASPMTTYLLAKIGNAYNLLRQDDLAQSYYQQAIAWHKEKNSAVDSYAYSLLGMSEIMMRKNHSDKDHILRNDWKKTVKLELDEAIKIYKAANNNGLLARCYTAMSKINELMGNFKDANEYNKLLIVSLDTLNARKQKGKVEELMIQFQVKDNEQKLAFAQKETATGRVIIFLLVGLFILSAGSVFLIVGRQKLKYQSEKKELELITLRSQMNPHFIFNCLTSINSFIVKSQIVEATNYLSKFARLIRGVLDNSKHSLVTIEDEIQTLTLYLDLEQMRFNQKFSYSISIASNINSESFKIAPMILQPFIENSIRHGLQHKKDAGHIKIDLSMRDQTIICIIEDNGVGRQKAIELESSGDRKGLEKSKSYGIEITKDRLKLLSKKGINASISIMDLKDDTGQSIGTKVEITMPVII